MRSLTQRRAALTRPPRVGVVVPGRQVTRTRRPYGSPEPDIARVNPNEESAVSVQVEDADAALVRLLHEQHAGPVYAFCVRFTGDPQRAEDVVQEVFLRAWRSLSSTDLRTRPVRPWLLQVARNLLTDAHRAERCRRVLVVMTAR